MAQKVLSSQKVRWSIDKGDVDRCRWELNSDDLIDMDNLTTEDVKINYSDQQNLM